MILVAGTAVRKDFDLFANKTFSLEKKPNHPRL